VKLVYMGTPEMAVAPLRALHAAGHEIVLVVSRPDRRRGRRGAPAPSPVKEVAVELGLEVSDDPDAAIGRDADLGVVVAYGRLLRPHLLAELDMVNLHFSLLPRWRGAAPVERALLAGDEVTGVCLMKVDEGLDTGCVYDSVEVRIDATSTAGELRAALVREGTALLVRSLVDGLGECAAQPSFGVTYAEKLSADDLELRWSLPSVSISAVVRVGGAWTTFRGGRLKVLSAAPVPGLPTSPELPELAGQGEARGSDVSHAPPGTIVALGRGVGVCTGDGVVELLQVQPAGKAPMAASDWANGARPVGERAGEEHPQ